MIYLFNLLFIFFWIKIYEKYNLKILLIPPTMFLIFIIGSQYYVGTDYPTYLEYFKGERDITFFLERKEILFYFMVKIANFLHIKGQGLFYIIGIIQTILLFKIMLFEKIIEKKSIFIFLFLTYSTFFHSQFNGIRQCISVYFFTLSILYFFIEDKKIKSSVSFIIGIGFHKSIIFMLPIFLLKKIITNKKFIKFLQITLIFLGIFIFLDIQNLIIKVIEYFVEKIGIYSSYMDSKYLYAKIDIKSKILRAIYIPIYYGIVSYFLKHWDNVQKNEKILLGLGLGLFNLKLIGVTLSLLGRISLFTDILIIFPIYLFLIRSYEKDKKIKYILLNMILFIYFIKIIVFPIREFVYNFYF